MADDFSLHEFTMNLSLVGWVALIAAMLATIYVIAKGTAMLVTKKCPFCEKRTPRSSTVCKFCKKAIG